MSTILLIGGTSGIGEMFAKRFHAMGKQVIITGRRHARLAELAKALPGLETYEMDNAELSAIPKHVEALFTRHPAIDTVWVNSGIQYASSSKDLSSTTDAKLAEEITVNLTAPLTIARHVVPRLLEHKSAASTNFMITSSGLGFVPVWLFPIYNATKAGVHQYLVSLRQQLKGTKVNVIEIVPPYVGDTGLGAEHADMVKGLTPMDLTEFTDTVFKVLDTHEASDLKEVAAGSAAVSVKAWRSSIGAILESRGIEG